MENDFLVINTGPLILLDKIEALDIAGQLPFHFLCPPAVRLELDAGIARSRTVIRPDWLTVRQLSSPLSPLAEISLDRGEAEVIQLALECRIPNVCLDDLHGRRVAETFGLKVTGLLGLLGRAKHLGIISRLRPHMDSLLAAGGRYSPKLIHAFLHEFGE